MAFLTAKHSPLLSSLLGGLTLGLTASPSLADPFAAPNGNGEDGATAEVTEPTGTNVNMDGLTAVVSKMAIKLYGYIKADMSYDSSDMSVGNFARWVEAGGEDDGQFNVTARQTRIGMSFTGPGSESVKVGGKIETDFYSGAAENSANPRMRHAFVNLDFVDSDVSVLAGQTSDLFSPMVPSTINYTVAWWSGDIGFRRPQVRVTKGIDVGDNSRLTVQGALARSIGGEESGAPGYQARVAYTFPGVDDLKTTVGFSGHSASEKGSGGDSNSTNLELNVPFSKASTFKMEYFMGENLDAYVGAIGVAGPVESDGFWFNFTHKATAKHTINVGYGMEDNDDEDLDAGDRTENSTLWANVFYQLTSGTKVGLEIQQHTTDYQDADEVDGIRVQGTVMFGF
jgi:hypothetical protein